MTTMTRPRTTTFHFTTLSLSLSSFFSHRSQKPRREKSQASSFVWDARGKVSSLPRQKRTTGRRRSNGVKSRWRGPNLGFWHPLFDIPTETALFHQLEKSLSAQTDFHSAFSPPHPLFSSPRANFSKSGRSFAYILDYTLSSYVYSSPFSRNLFRNWI